MKTKNYKTPVKARRLIAALQDKSLGVEARVELVAKAWGCGARDCGGIE